MPGAAGYLDERGVVRYWLTSVAPTLVEGDPADPRGGPDGPAIDDFLHRLGKAGLPAHRERDVGALNAATTTAFFPLVAAIDAGGGIERLLADRELFATVIDAAASRTPWGRSSARSRRGRTSSRASSARTPSSRRCARPPAGARGAPLRRGALRVQAPRAARGHGPRDPGARARGRAPDARARAAHGEDESPTP